MLRKIEFLNEYRKLVGIISLAEILTSNFFGTQLFFLGCNLDNNHGSNFITKNKICLVHQKRKLATIEINKFLI